MIEALGVSSTWRETAQANEFMAYLFLLVNTVNLNLSKPNSFYTEYQSALSRTLLRFCGTTFVETAVCSRKPRPAMSHRRRFPKSSVFKTCSLHSKTQSGRFQLPSVRRAFLEKLRSLDGLVWMVGLTGEFKLRFQIPFGVVWTGRGSPFLYNWHSIKPQTHFNCMRK